MSDKPSHKLAAAESLGRGRGRPCPVCGQPAAAAQHPFCSQRCRDVDLGRWLKGNYAIPGRAPGLGEEDDEEY